MYFSWFPFVMLVQQVKMVNLEVHMKPEQKQDKYYVQTNKQKNKQGKPKTNNSNTILTYNLSPKCCGLGILYPSWSKFAIFLPSNRGYGEPPKLQQVMLTYSKMKILIYM